MKKIIILLFGLMLSTTVLADGKYKQYDKVILTLVDGRVFDIEIDADSYIYSYVEEKEGERVQFVEVKGTHEEYIFERKEVASMKFAESVETAIEEHLIVDELNPMRYIDGVLTFHSSLNGEKMYLYDAVGREVLTATVHDKAVVIIKHLAKGTYVAKVKDINLKVVVR